MTSSFRDLIESVFVVEREGWVGERVQRVTRRLQQDVPEAERFETLVLWMDQHTAFTLPGRTIYFSRRLFERMPDDDAVAFVIAHELAHHRLGHVPDTARWGTWLPIGVVIRLVQRQICGPEDEHEADLRAIEIGLDSGYDLERCIAALEILRLISLDYGDVDGVLGSERRSHPPIDRRIAAARIHADEMHHGRRLGRSRRAERDRDRTRKVGLAIAGGAAVLALGLFLRR